MEIATLVLGIIGFILAWIPGCGIILGGIPAFIGIILGIIALAKKMPKKKQAIVGLVLSMLAFFAMIASIIIINILGVGIATYNSASNIIEEADFSEIEREQYNDEFEAYKGSNISGAQAMSLCDLVRNHNVLNSTNLNKQIEIVNGTASNKSADSFTSVQTSSAGMVKSTLRASNKYTVTLGYDPDTGLITQIGIKQSRSNSSMNTL